MAKFWPFHCPANCSQPALSIGEVHQLLADGVPVYRIIEKKVSITKYVVHNNKLVVDIDGAYCNSSDYNAVSDIELNSSYKWYLHPPDDGRGA